MNRVACIAVVGALTLSLGCAAPTESDEDIQSSSAAATSTDVTLDDGPTGAAYQITGWDGTTLTGFNKQGTSIATSFSADSVYRQANLDKYIPTDPCRDAAAAYNTADADAFNVALTSFAANSCNARVWINSQTGQIRAFRPVP